MYLVNRTVSLDPNQVTDVYELVKSKKYKSFSEFVRKVVTEKLKLS
ncbi:MAG: hypothetical protein ACPK7O_06260 [Methanobacterium sp.]